MKLDIENCKSGTESAFSKLVNNKEVDLYTLFKDDPELNQSLSDSLEEDKK